MQEPQRLLTRLNPITVDWKNQTRETGEVLRAEDIAACLAGLERGPYLLSLYLWSGDATVWLELYSLLFVEVKQLAIENNWRCKTDYQRLFSLIKMAMYEMRKGNICKSCEGSGIKLQDKCSSCGGIGKKRKTKTEYAKYCGVKVSNWVKCWDYKYSQVMLILIDWEEQSVSHLLAKL